MLGTPRRDYGIEKTNKRYKSFNTEIIRFAVFPSHICLWRHWSLVTRHWLKRKETRNDTLRCLPIPQWDGGAGFECAVFDLVGVGEDRLDVVAHQD